MFHFRAQPTTSDAIFPFLVGRKMSNAHSLSQWEKWMRPWHLNYYLQSRLRFTALTLRVEAIVRFIADATFLLPVTRSSSPNVHSLSQWRILFVRTTSYVIVTISVQKHSSPGTTVLTDYNRRHIFTSGLGTLQRVFVLTVESAHFVFIVL